MSGTMEYQISAEILLLASKANDETVTSVGALEYTQAALNLAHVLQVLKQIETIGGYVGNSKAAAAQYRSLVERL
jgi:hypothetical protein